MSNKIYKYPLEIIDKQEIEMPVGSEVLTIQAQREQPCLWVLVNTDEKITERRTIQMVGTGNPVEEDANKYQYRNYISTFQLQGGNLVFHCFELSNL